MSTPRQRLAARERNRALAKRKREGTVRLTVVANQLWLSEALQLSGFGHADNDDRKSLQSRLQALVDQLVNEAQRDA